MKRLTIILLIAVMMTSFVMPMTEAFAVSEVQYDISFKGKSLVFAQSPISENGITYVPMREFASHIDAEFEFQYEEKTSVLICNGTKIELVENKQSAVVNGMEKSLETPVKKINGLLYIPLRFVTENFGYEVKWDGDNNKIEITDGEGASIAIDKGKYYTPVGVTCSARQNDINVETNVLDLNYNTRWSCEDNGANITLELAEVSPVAYIGIACYNAKERQTIITVQVSEDGKEFKDVVKKFATSQTNNMEPVDFGGVYNAKYVRVVGYGNTLNRWNSITEIRVYAPSEDGELYVDMSGPDGVTNNSIESLSEKEREFLAEIDKLFDNFVPWIANMYDVDEKGFYAQMSGKDDPTVHPAIEPTAWLIRMIAEQTDLRMSMPEEVRLDWIEFFNSKQDPITGLYADKDAVDFSAAEVHRVNASTYSVIGPYLGGSTKYPHPFYDTASVSTEVVEEVLPEYMDSPQALVNWLESFNWERDSWRAASECESAVVYFNMLEEPKKTEMVNTLFDWLNGHQYDNGQWSTLYDYNVLSGIYKLTSVYRGLNRPMPKLDAIFDSIDYTFKTVSPNMAHYVRNPVSTLMRLAADYPEYAQRARDICVDNADAFLQYLTMFRAPDGGFTEQPLYPGYEFGPTNNGHSLWEGEADCTMMVLNTREDLYTIFGVKKPKFTMEGFWDVIEGKIPAPNCYDEKYDDIIKAQSDGVVGESTLSVEDFEKYEVGSLTHDLDGNVLMGGSTAAIRTDRNKPDNKYLSFSYDGKYNGWPEFLVSIADDSADGIAQIRLDAKTVTNVVELRLKTENMPSNVSNFILGFGYVPAYGMRFAKTSNGLMEFRSCLAGRKYVSETTGYIPVEEWVDLKVEYTRGMTPTSSVVKVYVNGQLVSVNNHAWNMNNGVGSNPMQKKLWISWQADGSGTICIDDIKFYKKAIK